MIRYNPADSDIYNVPIQYRPKTCFIMCRLRKPIPNDQAEIRIALGKLIKKRGYAEIDAESSIIGKDFLSKIWNMVYQVPIGIAIITRGTSRRTLGNIFYEIGLLEASGKETLVIKTRDTQIPSDFIRTEYIEYDSDFETQINKYFDTITELQQHFNFMAQQLKKDPLLAIDYMRRAYILTGDETYRNGAKKLYSEACKKGMVVSCVQELFVKF